MTTVGIIFLVIFFILIIITGFIIYKNPNLIPNLIKKLSTLFKPKQGIIHEDSYLVEKLPEPSDLSSIEKLPVNNDLLSEEYEEKFNKMNENKLKSYIKEININLSCPLYKTYFIKKAEKFSDKIKNEYKNIYAKSFSYDECITKLRNDWNNFDNLIYNICSIANGLYDAETYKDDTDTDTDLTNYVNAETFKLLNIAKSILLYKIHEKKLDEIHENIKKSISLIVFSKDINVKKLHYKKFLLYIDPEEMIENIILENQ